MINVETVFDEWNIYAQKKVLQPRELDLEELKRNAKNKIITITGIRRSGKSSVAMLLLQKLLIEGEKAAYINVEDSRIKNHPEILDELIKWFGDQGYLLLDEITSVQDWEGWLARNHELLKGKLHIIASSSRRKLAVPVKQLRGRILSYELYPLMFREFLEFRNIQTENTTAGRGVLEKALKDYLIYGGFPEVTLAEKTIDKVQILNSYFRDIIGLDVAELSGENVSTVELFGKYVLETTTFSASKCLNFFKSLGHKIGKQSLLNLEQHAQNSYLFFFVQVFSYTIKDRTQYPRKAYAGDTGFLQAITGKTDMGKLYENTVFLELQRRKKLNEEINYWRDQKGTAVDFVVRKGTKVVQAIQVTYDMNEENTRERELKGIMECARSLKLKEGLIITRSEERTEHNDGVKLTYIPLWKWLLRT